MKNTWRAFAAAALILSCGTGPGSTVVEEELFFAPRPLPDPASPPEAGARQTDSSGEEGILRSAFRDAYVEALFRGLPLEGVLGGDRVNPWPAESPVSWSQNWSSTNRESNSFGIPGLVLALGAYGVSGSPVYTVSGPVLNHYGTSSGMNRANGAAGYGIPLGEAFVSEGEMVQRFSRGMVIAGRDGARFSFGPDPAPGLLEKLSEEERQKEFGGRDLSPEQSAAFAHAWAFAFSVRQGDSDGPVGKVSFSRPWVLETQGESLTLDGFYYKSYNRGKDVLVLLSGEGLPLRPHLLSGPFLQAVLSRRRLSGLPLGRASMGSPAGTGLGRSLAEGFALYGPPLSDSLPWPEIPVNPEAAEGEPPFLEAQRFARGWIVLRVIQKREPEVEEAADEIPAVDVPAPPVPASAGTPRDTGSKPDRDYGEPAW